MKDPDISKISVDAKAYPASRGFDHTTPPARTTRGDGTSKDEARCERRNCVLLCYQKVVAEPLELEPKFELEPKLLDGFICDC